MLFPIIGVGLLLAILLKSARSGERVTEVTSQYVVSTWGGIIAPLAKAANLNLQYVLRWIEVESGGNPCAVGNPKALGPDGTPKELGIVQLYNPDDLIKLKATGAELRAYCVPGTQRVSRVLTPAEMLRQAQLAIDLIVSCRKSAAADLLKVGATWDSQSRDFYNLIKLQHGLPGISRSGIPATSKFLGHAPRDWVEFRQTLSKVKLDPGTEAYRFQFDGILNNAEKTGAVVPQ